MKNLKYIFFILMLVPTIIFSQSNDSFKEVDSLLKIRQPNAAKDKLWDIFNYAKRNKNKEMLIKAFPYFRQTINYLEYEDRAKLYLKLKTEANSLPEPTKSIYNLRLIQDLTYNFQQWYGFQQNEVFDTLNIKGNTERHQYLLSEIEKLEKQLKLLNSYPFKKYENVLLSSGNRSQDDRKDSLFVYHSLGDFISYQLIKLYQSDILAHYGELKIDAEPNPNWYQTPDNFETLEFDSHTISNRILKLYQNISTNNANNLDYLSVATYLRLHYLKSTYNNDSLVNNAWANQFNYFDKFSVRSKFLYEIEKNRYQKGAKYHFKDNPAVKTYIKTAYDNLQAELNKFPDNDFKSDINNLISLIESPSISLKMPDIFQPKKKIPVLILHRNIRDYVIRIYKTKDYNLKDYNQKQLIHLFQENKLDLVQTRKINLTDEGLFQMRSTEFMLDEISDNGVYYVVITKEEIDLKNLAKDENEWGKNNITSQKIYISEIAASSNFSDGRAKILVVDQSTGKPVQNARVELYHNDYRYKSDKPHTIGKTNKEGVFEARIKNGSYIAYLVSHKSSVLDHTRYVYHQQEGETYSTAKLLTDRAIYRPGQTVYFKGIVYKGKSNDYQVLSKEKVKIVIKDASYQTIFEETFTTNSWGSFDGQLQLPSSLPLGNFSIQVSGPKKFFSSIHYFSVEEYKRPTFEVKLNQPKKEAKLNDTITVTGFAKAFAGFPIDNAKITYSVYRNWQKYRYYFNYEASGDLLKEGETKTDENGEFLIDFIAETDPNAIRYAFYYYEVKVKITDQSGETHEQNITLNLSEIPVSLEVDLQNQLFTHENIIIKPEVVNLYGHKQENETGKATLSIYKVKAADRFLPRLWDNPEFSYFTEDNQKIFAKLFPYRQLNDENKTQERVLVNTFSFNIGDSIEIQSLIENQLKNKQGRYIFEFSYQTENTKKPYDLKIEKEITLIDVKAKELPFKSGLWSFVSSSSVDVGESLDFQVGSSFKNAKALISFYRGKDLVSSEWIDLNNRYSTCYVVQEKDRGFLSYEVLLFNNGEFYHDKKQVSVPFSNKKLEIKTQTFRDKLLPGQKERWVFTVQDNDGEWIKSEMAATMYDASLNQFRGNHWSLWPYHSGYHRNNNSWSLYWSRSFVNPSFNPINWNNLQSLEYPTIRYDRIIDAYSFGFYNPYYYYPSYARNEGLVALESETNNQKSIKIAMVDEVEMKMADSDVEMEENIEDLNDKSIENKEPSNIRTNFNETAFFYPTIYSNDENKYVLDFTLPESLTKWSLLLLAHNKEMQVGSLSKTIEAKKELMITANAPRFVRQGDEIDFAAKVVNLTDKEQIVNVDLLLENPENSSELSLTSESTQKTITVSANSSIDVSWNLKIGNQTLIQYTLSASNEQFSDGERNILPVLSNRQFITETNHILIRESGKIEHTFESFTNQNSSTLDNKSFTVEYIDNLVWNAVLALPYLSKTDDQSSISLSESFYANSIAKKIVDANPKIQQIFEQWKLSSPDVFLSELEKSQELKNILLNETPWVVDAKNETEQRRRIATLFEINQLQNNQAGILNKLKKKQNSDGGFSWFDGGMSSAYITQNILTRLGQLQRLNIDLSPVQEIIKNAEKFVTNEQIKFYNKYLKTAKERDRYSLSTMDVYWLFTRTFFDNTKSEVVDEIVNLYQEKLKKSWTQYNPYLQAFIGIYFNKVEITRERDLIYASLKDRAYNKKDKGMYWVENSGYYWHQNKISTQAMIISFFQEINVDQKLMDDARLWLILNKESNAWETGSATADAIYAILLSGRDYLSENEKPIIKVGNKTLVFENSSNNNEIEVDWTPGLGQIKQQWNNNEINSDLGNIVIDKKSDVPAVLNMYWQYTEELSKIKSHSDGSMKIKKKYYKITSGAKGEERTETNSFQIGDKIEVELTISTDRDLEFVYVKDLRPAGFKPTQTISYYTWRNALIYYQSPRDASMEYFIEWMRKGSYKISYTVYATHSGKFDSGVATIQSYYAPKFSGHSDSEKINIVK